MRRRTFDALVSVAGLLLTAALSRAHPASAALAGQVQTVFQGTTLRSMLLEAYGFWTFAQIALIGAIAAWAAAGLMLVLSVLGFVHLRRTGPGKELLAKVARQTTVTSS